MTYRERRLAKAARLRGWAGKREVKADAAYDTAHTIGDQIPFGQPILVGHHSEGRMRRAAQQIDSNMRKSVENSAKADEMRSRADNIQAAADNAIYSDDPDAIERLEEKIAGLESQRACIKAFNASCRKGALDSSLLTGALRKDYETTKRTCPGFIGKAGEMPTYHLTNLSGNINRLKKRLMSLQRRSAA